LRKVNILSIAVDLNKKAPFLDKRNGKNEKCLLLLNYYSIIMIKIQGGNNEY